MAIGLESGARFQLSKPIPVAEGIHDDPNKQGSSNGGDYYVGPITLHPPYDI